MTWRASPSKCATRRASSRPRSRRLPTSCAARSRAWTKTISAPACNAARIGCAAASSPIRRKPPSPAICKSWVNRSATRLAPWAARSTLPRTPSSTAPWTIYPVCATNSPASADVPTLSQQGQSGQGQQPAVSPAANSSTRPTQPQRASRSRRPTRSAARPKRPARPRQGQQGRRSSKAVSGQGGQAGGRQAGVRAATASPVSWQTRRWRVAMATAFGDIDTGNTRIPGQAAAPAARSQPGRYPARRSTRD